MTQEYDSCEAPPHNPILSTIDVVSNPTTQRLQPTQSQWSLQKLLDQGQAAKIREKTFGETPGQIF